MTRHVDDRNVTTTVVTHGGSDMRAAFMGLIIGSLAVLAVVFTIVKLTNRAFEGHEAPAAGEHAAPAAHTPAPAAPTTTTPAAGAPATGAPATPPPSTPH